MGHLARLLEEAEIATVVVGIRAFRRRLKMMTLPRVLITPHLMGRTLGLADDYDTQYRVVSVALDLLDNASQVGTIVDFPIPPG